MVFTAGIPGFKFQEWLYGPWDENKYIQFQMLYAVPGVRDYMDMLLDQRADSEYMKNNQMTWSDIHDPRKLSQTGSSARVYSNAYRMIGKNIDRLYR